MDARVEVSLNGLEEKLEQLGAKLAKRSLRKALKQAMQVLADEAVIRAPIDSGDLKGSIGVLTRLSPSQGSGVASVGPIVNKGGSAGKPFNQQPALYAKSVELGIARKPAYPMQPFLRPAFDSKADAVVAKFAEVLRNDLDKVIKS